MNLKRFILAQVVTVVIGCAALVSSFIRNLLNNPFRNLFTVNERKVPDRLNDSKYGTHKYIKANNIKLHYVESGDPSKPLMLFIHGFPEFWYSWRHQIVHFNKNYRCVAVDMRGYGESEKPNDIASYKIDILVEDIRDLIRQLGATKCIIVAHDWGGIVCCRFRDAYPEVLDAMILFGSASIEAWFDLIWNSSQQFWKSLYVFMFRAPYVPEFILRMGDLDVFKNIMLFKGKNGVDMEDIKCFEYNYSRKDAFTPGLNYYRANFNYGLKTTKHDENVPFLVAGAEKDTALSLDLLTTMKKAYTHIEVMEVKDCGHFMQQEDPDKVNSIIKDFLSKHKL